MWVERGGAVSGGTKTIGVEEYVRKKIRLKGQLSQIDLIIFKIIFIFDIDLYFLDSADYLKNINLYQRVFTDLYLKVSSYEASQAEKRNQILYAHQNFFCRVSADLFIRSLIVQKKQNSII